MKYVITGGAGFIGSHLVDRLLAQSQAVTVIDNLSSGKLAFLERNLKNPSLTFIQADLLDLDRVKEAMAGHEMVFHLAANPDVRLSLVNTRLDLEQETIATYNVLEAMRTAGVKKVAFASSSTVYGEAPGIPLSEDYGPLLPISLYGAGKLAAEGLISSYCHSFNMHSWIFRFANVVGDRLTHGVIFDFLNKLRRNSAGMEVLGDGSQSKPYIHVQDCLDGMLFALQHASGVVNVFNLGTETVTSAAGIARMLTAEMGLKDVKLKFTGGDRGWVGDVPQVKLDVGRMTKLGWRTRYSSDQAVQAAIRDALGRK